MDGISSMFSSYPNNLTSSQTSKSANNISSMDNLDLSNATDEELMGVCEDFEAYFLEQVMKEMTKTIGQDEDSDTSTSSLVSYFKDSTIADLAKQSTQQNSLGLAQTLYEQMKRNTNL